MRVRYLRPAKQMPEIYLYRALVDFREQANGLRCWLSKSSVIIHSAVRCMHLPIVSATKSNA